MVMGFFRKRVFGSGTYGTGLAFAILVLMPGGAMAQNVLWEDYRGESSVATDANYIGPPGRPKFTNNPNGIAMAPFRALTANPANAARTGTSANIDFRQSPANQTALCNSAAGTGWQNSDACRYQAQGRVLYALISFPQAGSYTLSAAHDDNLVVELSTDYANTNYRSASYDIPVGALAEWTTNDETFEEVGSFNAANANSCALIRVYWTNQNGVNHNRLRWTRPNAGPGTTTEIVPASAFRDPSLPTSANGCNGSITGNGTAVTLNKVLGSPRLNSGDQITIEIGTTQAGGTVRSATTSGTGTGQQASTGAFPAATGTTYYLREVMASGSVSTLTAYAAGIACTRNGTAFAPTPEGAPANRRWSVVPAANDQIVCTITNTAPMADLSITKSNGASEVTTGDTTMYTIVVTNNGPAAANNAMVRDPAVSGLDCTSLTCSATGGADCPDPISVAGLQGSGLVIPALPNEGSVTFQQTCTVTATGLP